MAHHRLLPTALVLLLVTACGQNGEPQSPGASPHLDVGDTDLGEVLVDAEGFTLYAFLPDPPGSSVCVDQCAAAWPPLLVDGEVALGGSVDETLVGTTERDDGTIQVTYDGMPLYTWVSDNEPGETTGQGVEGEWYVVSPEGDVLVEPGVDEEAEMSNEPATPDRDGQDTNGDGY